MQKIDYSEYRLSNEIEEIEITKYKKKMILKEIEIEKDEEKLPTFEEFIKLKKKRE